MTHFSFSKAISGNTICKTQVRFYIVTRLQSAQPTSRVSIPGRASDFHFLNASRPVRGLTPCLIQGKGLIFSKTKAV